MRELIKTEGWGGIDDTTLTAASSWNSSLIAGFNGLIGRLRFRQGEEPPTNPMHFILDENIMEYTSDWCTACNTEATNHIPIKEFLFGTSSAQGRAKNPFMRFRNVPTKSNLPLGMRVMNDAYVFIYTISCFIAVLVKNLSSSEQNQTRVGFLF
jgi:hypothetical protein